jgi:hypothetical protein
MIVIDALVAALRAEGLQVIEQPQAATNTNARIDLWLAGYTLGGEKKDNNPRTYETLTFNADVTASGVAKAFVGELRKILKTMLWLGETSLMVPVIISSPQPPAYTRKKFLRAHFQKIAEGAFEYESEGSPMPARFVERWRITVTYPAGIIAGEEEEKI